MADLLDIAPSTACAAVWIDGQRMVVRGLPPNAIASIIARFPKVRSIVASDGDDAIVSLIRMCGTALGPIIAAGSGHLEEVAYEEAATRLPLDQQVKCFTAIWRLTFPNGLTPFLSAMSELAVVIKGEGVKPIKIRSRTSSKALHSISSPSAGAPESHPTMQ